MERYLNKFYNIIEKIGKHNFILITFILVSLVITGIYQTFSLYTQNEGLSVVDGIKTYSFILSASNTTNSVTIAAGNTKYVDITVSNESSADLMYEVYYSTSADLTNVNFGYTSDTAILPSGVMTRNSSGIVTLRIDNTTSSNLTVTFGLVYGFENGGGLSLGTGNNSISLYDGQINSPELDDGNLIPVYYDESEEVWKKADSSNSNNSWYDYKNKEWANAVIVGDSTAKSTYDSASVGTTIADADITAFYVWIPAFKYRVWNINRQPGDESTYAYPAFTNGIEILFEGDTATGNVGCTYDVTTIESKLNLSDVCVYNNTDTITTFSDNTDYINAWYTHPAFKSSGSNIKKGFWFGKFETTGTQSNPTVLPDIESLAALKLSVLFGVSTSFSNYLSDSDLDAYAATNLEWGAVTYLTHSIYGMCDENGCDGVKFNNSYGYYTGRSSGEIGANTVTEAEFYENASLTTNIYNTNGYYNYKGYKLDSDGNVTTTKDLTKVASTTGNITGIYDMAGGSADYVMANMVDSSGNFWPVNAGNDWPDGDTLDANYYDSYSYGTSNDYAFNRARLGDATAELYGTSAKNTLRSWQPGFGLTGSRSYFLMVSSSSNYVWFLRSGNCTAAVSTIFTSGRGQGGSSGASVDSANYTIRSVLS